MVLTYTRTTVAGPPTTARMTPTEVASLIKVVRSAGFTVATSDEGMIFAKGDVKIVYTLL